MKRGIEIGPRPVSWAVVRGKPLQASFWKLDDLAPHPIRGRTYRSSSGNERHEFSIEEPEQGTARIAFVRDAATSELSILDVDQKILLAKDRLGTETMGFGARFNHRRHRTIQGFDCCLVNFQNDEGELWWSEELSVTLEDNPTGKQVTYRLFDIECTEPDEDRFTAEGYTPLGARRTIFDPSLA
jgi:hypothetical protein